MRPIFKVLDFSCTNDGLTEAIAFLRRHLSSGLLFRNYAYKDILMNFFPQSLKKFLTYKVLVDDQQVKKVDGDRYECMVYSQLKQGIANTTVFIKDSNCYRTLDDELIDIEY